MRVFKALKEAYDQSILFQIIVWIVLMIVVLSVMPAFGHFSRPEVVQHELEVSYSSVVLVEKNVNWAFAWHGCSRDDAASFTFTAVNSNNEPITGTACVQTFSHKVFVIVR